MGLFRSDFALWITGAVLALFILVIGILASAWLRGVLAILRRWLPALALLATVVSFLLLHFYLPRTEYLHDAPLPWLAKGYYWCWVLMAILGLVASAVVLRAGLRTGMSRSQTGGPLDEAWAALLACLKQARIDLGRQQVHLFLAPDQAGEAMAQRLVRAAGVRLIAKAPAGPAPIHAYGIHDGVLLSCDGDWSSGRQANGAGRVFDLGQKLRAGGLDRPFITGIAVLFPFEWAGRFEALDQAVVAGEEIRILYQALGYRCPVRAIFTGLESIPGAPEFIRRLAAIDPRKTQARVIFDVPSSVTFDAELAHRATDWIASWFHARVLDLLISDPFDYWGNSELVRFDYEFRRRRRRLAAILEAALLDLPHDEERILFRGGCFAATGDEPGTRAFAAGLLHGPAHPILARHRGATWTRESTREDRRYRWAAVGLAMAVGLVAVLVWLHIQSRNAWVGRAGLLSLALAWASVLLWPRRRIGATQGDRGPKD